MLADFYYRNCFSSRVSSSPIRLTLVSRSPRRSSLLTLLNIPFDVAASDASERWGGRNVREIAERNALRKLRACTPMDARHRLFLTADTVIEVGGRFLGKPIGPQAAARMLSLLSGRWHWVVTGMALAELPQQEVQTTSAATAVLFKPLTPADISRYVRSEEWRGKAGAYAIQGKGADFVETIVGSFSNVIGLPLGLLARTLEQGWRDYRFL